MTCSPRSASRETLMRTPSEPRGTVRVFREVWFWHLSTYAKAYVARIKELCAQHSSHRQEWSGQCALSLVPAASLEHSRAGISVRRPPVPRGVHATAPLDGGSSVPWRVIRQAAVTPGNPAMNREPQPDADTRSASIY